MLLWSFPEQYHESKDRPDVILISIPYLTILTYISNIPRITDPVSTQFMVMQSSPKNGYELIFVSNLHEL